MKDVLIHYNQSKKYHFISANEVSDISELAKKIDQTEYTRCLR